MGDAIIQQGTFLRGDVTRCRRLEVHGYVEGKIAAEKVVVGETGELYGTIRVDNAEILGTVQGNLFVKHMISIAGAGSVSGNVQYSQIQMAHGASLSAQLRNVPPQLAGDLNLVVDSGKSVAVTPMDLSAIDPDDDAKSLTYTVSNATHGFLTLAGAPSSPVERFTQADLEAGRVIFVHDGTRVARASFGVVVADAAGATSGAAQTVEVVVRGV